MTTARWRLQLDQEQARKYDQIWEGFVPLCKKHKMNPSFALETFTLRNRGLNYAEVAAKTGIARDTARLYTRKIGEIDREDFLEFFLRAALLQGGIVFFKPAWMLEDR